MGRRPAPCKPAPRVQQPPPRQAAASARRALPPSRGAPGRGSVRQRAAAAQRGRAHARLRCATSQAPPPNSAPRSSRQHLKPPKPNPQTYVVKRQMRAYPTHFTTARYALTQTQHVNISTHAPKPQHPQDYVVKRQMRVYPTHFTTARYASGESHEYGLTPGITVRGLCVFRALSLVLVARAGARAAVVIGNWGAGFAAERLAAGSGCRVGTRHLARRGGSASGESHEYGLPPGITVRASAAPASRTVRPLQQPWRPARQGRCGVARRPASRGLWKRTALNRAPPAHVHAPRRSWCPLTRSLSARGRAACAPRASVSSPASPQHALPALLQHLRHRCRQCRRR